jgi:signal transduction histidine kinase/CheY-like chemotaxis protein/HPt (histidine-containing phosphotransfer) domain-containing protein
MIRISFALVSQFLILLLVARALNLIPDPDAARVEKRAAVCNGLAAAVAVARTDDPAVANLLVGKVLEQNPDAVSAAVRIDDRVIAATDGHADHWAVHDPTRSTPTHLHAPLLRAGAPVGRVELTFRPLPYSGWWRYAGGPFFPLFAFVGVTGLAVTVIYLRTVFRRLEAAQAKLLPEETVRTLNALGEGVLILNQNQVIVFANKEFVRLSGVPSRAVVRRKVTDLGWQTEDGATPDDYPWAKAVREGNVQTGILLRLQSGGRNRKVSVNSCALFKDGACRGALVTFDDLTPAENLNMRLKAQKKQLRKAKDAAEAANKAKGEFLANVSHEIRTPMNAIIGMTELVLEGRLTHEQRECLGIVEESATSLLGVINDLLDLSKIEAGKFALDPVDFDLRAILDDTLQALALRAHKKGLELACDIPRGVPEGLVGDPVRLRQVVVNLVGNAIKFTTRGEVLVRVRVDAQGPREARLHFTVSDTGIGIPADRLQAIFDPFTQADGSTTRRYGGTGLGLAIASHLVELMGGAIWAESEVGQGSTFHFTARFGVPVVSDASFAIPDLSLVHQLPVLVVEGNPTTRHVLTDMLAGLSMRPTAADGPDAARAAAAKAAAAGNPFPLVLVDAAPAGADGFELAAGLTKSGAVGAVVMMLSSADLPRDMDRCRWAGAASYLRKPVRKADLVKALQRVVDPTHISGQSITPPPRAVPADSPESAGLSVLLVEDNPFNQKVSAMKLERLGHRVRVAASGREALAALDGETFDLLFTDIQMPDMDGFKLTAAVRAREGAEGSRLPVVAMTAHAMKGDRERCLAAGMDDYVSKPVRDEELVAAIRRVVSVAPSAEETLPRLSRDTQEFVLPIPTTARGVDEEAVLARVGGNRETLRGLIEVFYQDGNTLMADLHEALKAGDAARVRAGAHTVKGMVGFFGAGPAAAAAARLEKAGERDELTGAAELYATLARELEALGDGLTIFASAPPAGWHLGRADRSEADVFSPAWA